MAEWVMEDSILAPRDKIVLNYKGPNPFEIYKKMDSDFFQKKFEVGGTDFWERDFRWSAGEDPHSFFIRIFVNKDFDSFTNAIFEISFQGKQPSDPSKNGEVTITIGGNLVTKFELGTPFRQTSIFRGLLWLYTKFYYWNIRRTYLKICQEKINNLVEEIRNWTGVTLEG